MYGTKTVILTLAVVAMFMTMPGLAAAEDITQDRDLSVDILTGSTSRMGGGDWIALKAGDIIYAVVYGTETNPNHIIILTEQKRYLGGADVYLEDGEFLRTQGIPVDLVYATKLVAMVEYRDIDNDSLFDLRWMNDVPGLVDMPVKAASLNLSWEMNNLAVHMDDYGATVDFDLTATDVPYTWIWPEDNSSVLPKRPWMPADGVVERVTFSCHLSLMEENKTIEMVPWYRVQIGDDHEIESTFDGYRNYTANVFNGSVKYDHNIVGWDFASDENRLAVEVGILAGVHATGQIAERLRARVYEMRCEMNGTVVASDEGNGPIAPLLARDTLRLQSSWERFGRFSWVTNVTVDGIEKDMLFQVQNGGMISFWDNGHYFLGFMVRAAFLYPSGENIFHDPVMQSTATDLSITETVNAFPQLISLLQLVAVLFGLAIAVALGIFLRKGREGRRASLTPVRQGLPVSPHRREPPANPPVQPSQPPLTGGKEQ